jgi:cytoskeletal protein RodZ
MDQFDQEIKNILNSKTYSYKPQAWSAFKRHSGMPAMSIGAKIGLFGGIAAAIVGGILFFTLPHPVESITDNSIAAHEQNTSDPTLADTVSPIVSSETVATTEPIVTASPKPKQSYSQTPTSSESFEHSQASATAPTQPRPATQQPSHYGRPLEILVDTISSNDFPDYPAKPADMLP